MHVTRWLLTAGSTEKHDSGQSAIPRLALAEQVGPLSVSKGQTAECESQATVGGVTFWGTFSWKGQNVRRSLEGSARPFMYDLPILPSKDMQRLPHSKQSENYRYMTKEDQIKEPDTFSVIYRCFATNAKSFRAIYALESAIA